MAEKFVIPIHGPDHCPGGPDPIPCLPLPTLFRAWHFDDAVGNDITVGGTTNVDVTYNYWDENFDATVFRPETAAGGTPTLGTHNVQHIDLVADGYYIISWGVHWETSHTGLTQMSIHDADLVFSFPDTVVHAGNGAFNTDGFLVQTMAREYPLLDPFASGPGTPSISTDVAQSSGSSKLVDIAWLEIAYQAVAS